MDRRLRKIRLALVLACGVAASFPATGQESGGLIDQILPGFAGGIEEGQGLPFSEGRNDSNASSLEAVLEANGYARLLSAERTGGMWIVEAVRNNGAVHKLRIDAARGTIISRRKAGWTRVPTPGFGEQTP